MTGVASVQGQADGEGGPSSSQPMVLVPIVSRLPGGHTVVGMSLSQLLQCCQAILLAACLLLSLSRVDVRPPP